MKLIVLMAVEEYADKLRQIMRTHQVMAYSESEMKGWKLFEEHRKDNWFGDRHLPIQSHIAFAFVEATKAEALMSEIQQQADGCKDGCPIRAFLLNVERAI